jgi:lambda repressor-like predicted transcriptional regulator
MASNRPLPSEKRRSIAQLHSDGWAAVDIAKRVGVHRHTVANVLDRGQAPKTTQLRAQIAELTAAVAERDRDNAALRREVAQLRSAGQLGQATMAVPRAPTPAERRAQSQATPPRSPPAWVIDHGLTAFAEWYRLEAERQRDGYPVPSGPYHGWTEVKMRVWLTEVV